MSDSAVIKPAVAEDVLLQPKVAISEADANVYTSNWSLFKAWLGRIHWINLIILSLVPVISIVGFLNTPVHRATVILSILYYFFTGFGITAGYHRLFAHRAYQVNTPTRFMMMLAGSGALEGSIKWWAGGHRIHHRYTDTPKDPYNAQGGFWYAHMGWMLIKPDPKNFVKADIRDLNQDWIVTWQHKYYLFIGPFMAFVVPTLIAGLGWGDWLGGYFFAGAFRLFLVHHSTFCVNSVAHYLGEQTFDDMRSPRDNIITALLTFGEGYHNFHHEFPNDYRNGIKWYHWDPTKWLILSLKYLKLASKLKIFPMNEITRGMIYMKEKKLDEMKASVKMPPAPETLPVMTFQEYETAVKVNGRKLVLISGLIHDVTEFLPSHPGGEAILKGYLGTDATDVFLGRTQLVLYKHSHAAANILSNMRVARVDSATLPKSALAGVSAATSQKSTSCTGAHSVVSKKEQ